MAGGGGGGGGGGGYIPPASEALSAKVERARDAEDSRLEADIADYLRGLLARFNDRDVEQTRERLDDVHEALGDHVDIETFLYGGSVAKHTYVDGLSDVDALAVLDDPALKDAQPSTLLKAFEKLLRNTLATDDVVSISSGRMAVTIKYADGGEAQILPALRSGKQVLVPQDGGKGWNRVNPAAFQRRLSDANRQMNAALVPAIKLFKSIVATLPQQQQVKGYHAESLALDAVASYDGPKTHKAVLLQVLSHAKQRVLQPLPDVTGQSRNVDEYLGAANSNARRNVAVALERLHRRLSGAASLAHWKALLPEPED